MTAKGSNTDATKRTDGWAKYQRHRVTLIFAAVVISLLAHLISVVKLDGRGTRMGKFAQPTQKPIKIKIVETKKPELKPEKSANDDKMPKILEMPQLETEAPDKADYVGTVDHKAKQEMRISDKVKRDRAKDPGQKGRPDTPRDAVVQADRLEQPKQQKSPKESNIQIRSKTGSLTMDAFRPKPRNDYEALLPTSVADLPGQLTAGFQDYVDDKVQEGDRIDINTTNYRFIGYFTNMRKAIELVWNYPSEASQRGMQGEVGLEFAINKDGKATQIRVIKSSGYPILDRAIVEAIKLASPFSPLPDGFQKNKLVVTGSFRYILSAYGSH